jgi:hypothetical protein
MDQYPGYRKESHGVEMDHYRNIAFRRYESVRFRVVCDVLVNRKDYNDATG